MKWIILVIIFSGLAVFGIVRKNNQNKQGTTQTIKSYSSFAVLELFTSEGCSSCPPADRLLPQLAAEDPGIIPLSFHVDYWNHLGWKDSFSNSEFSDRQKEYGQHFKLESIYTPQLVINGVYELVGSNKLAAETDIKRFLKENAPVQLTIDEVKKENNKLSVSCHLEGNWQNSDLLAAVVQKHAEMNVKAGENHGAKLSHTNVVRTFISLSAKEKVNFEISVPDNVTADNWQLIIYTQKKSNLKITGAAVYN
ncbi:MAG: DUF1223 domain-containing protein [Chitinophagales bacterium]